MKKFIFLFAFCITVTNIFAQTDPNQIKKEGNDAFLRCICNRLLLNILQVISQKYGLNL